LLLTQIRLHLLMVGNGHLCVAVPGTTTRGASRAHDATSVAILKSNPSLENEPAHGKLGTLCWRPVASALEMALWLSCIPQDRLDWRDAPVAHPLQTLIKGSQSWLSSPRQRYCSLPFLSTGATWACLIWDRFVRPEMISFSPTLPLLLAVLL
jgi:hypothetical protein